MNPDLAALRQALTAIGLVDINASDAQVQQAWAQYQQQNPQGAQQIMQQIGGGGIAGLPWLTILGVGGGLIALYLVWRQYGSRRRVDAFEYPESDDEGDARPRLHAMSKSLGTFKSLGAPKGSSCRAPRRLGKYEFEPERRLEGYRRKKR